MWGLLSRRTQVLVIAGLAIVLAWGIEGAAALSTGNLPSPLKLIALVVTIISTGIVAIASAVWRKVWNWSPIIGRKLFPDLTGTWAGELVSTWKNPATGQGVAPIPVTIWIRQGLFSTSIKLRSGESTSYSTRCLLEADPEAGRFRFWYSYDNDPRAEYRHRSARHEGVAWLELDIDTDPERLVGCYYTDRRTSGDIEVRRLKTKIASEPVAAAAA
jgi:SMODS-associating 2TM, beta-strand rich effector domain